MQHAPWLRDAEAAPLIARHAAYFAPIRFHAAAAMRMLFTA